MSKNIIIVIVLLLLIGGGYFYMQGSKGNEAASTKAQPEQAIGAEIFSALTRLESLKLDETVFANPVYKNLKSFSREIERKPKGKDNPFNDNSGFSGTANTSTSLPSASATTSATSTSSTEE